MRMREEVVIGSLCDYKVTIGEVDSPGYSVDRLHDVFICFDTQGGGGCLRKNGIKKEKDRLRTTNIKKGIALTFKPIHLYLH